MLVLHIMHIVFKIKTKRIWIWKGFIFHFQYVSKLIKLAISYASGYHDIFVQFVIFFIVAHYIDPFLFQFFLDVYLLLKFTSRNCQAVHICITVERPASTTLLQILTAWQLPDNIWQQNQHCCLLFSNSFTITNVWLIFQKHINAK